MALRRGRRRHDGRPPESLFDAAHTPVPDEPVAVVDVASAPIGVLRALFVDGTPTRADLAALLVRLDRVESVNRGLEASRLGVRSEDPNTSAEAAAEVRRREGTSLATFRAGTHKHRLLAAYAAVAADWPTGVTDPQAAQFAGLYDTPACWWKRSSELRQVGYVEVTGAVREDPATGKERECCAITDAGRAYLAVLGEVPE